MKKISKLLASITTAILTISCSSTFANDAIENSLDQSTIQSKTAKPLLPTW